MSKMLIKFTKTIFIVFVNLINLIIIQILYKLFIFHNQYLYNICIISINFK